MPEKSFAEILTECTERCRNMDAPLADRLQVFADEVRALNPEFAEVVERMVARLKSAGVGEDAPQPGETMPEFVLPDEQGRLTQLSELTAKGPVAVTFHRGHWCPYCQINASALTRIHAGVQALGGEIVAITPEAARFNAGLKDEARARFPVLSDMDNAYAMLLNLAFYVGEEKQRFMTAAGWDIAPYQGSQQWMLPVPATFIVGRDGLVKARFIDPDYRRRMDTDAILDAVRQARG
jgi:peroxiredoxin